MASASELRETWISTIEPEAIPGGSRMDGNSIYINQHYDSIQVKMEYRTSRLSSVSNMANPASSFPTVRDMSMVGRNEHDNANV